MMRTSLLAALLAWTWAVAVYHLGVFVPPPVPAVHAELPQRWIPKEKAGINQLVLFGNPYERGLAEGAFTRDLLLQQESDLIGRLRGFIPHPVLLRVLQLATIRWFWGADQYFEPWMLQEMNGISHWAPAEFDGLADGYTRQLYYHGVHEVGQMMVDQASDDLGCTVAAERTKNGWLIGRNFDFEAGRVFDVNKIMKWVFPDEGLAYVSVTWAGMVGAVTGVNERGVYLSLNAAGARDFRRYGMPTTLVLLKALQFAKTADEAVAIIRDSTTFISDIFVVADRGSETLYRVEKTPHHTEVIPLRDRAIVTNHLESPYWNADPVNLFRRDELTSGERARRGNTLVSAEPAALDSILSILRDKGEKDGAPLHLGNRNAIDPLIATHSVVFDAPDFRLYVSRGPSLAGAFTGYDLEASFRKRTPVESGNLPGDPAVDEATYYRVKHAADDLAHAESALRKRKDCAAARPWLDQASHEYDRSYTYSTVLGEYRECTGDHAGAREAWNEALHRDPAYLTEKRHLNQLLEHP